MIRLSPLCFALAILLSILAVDIRAQSVWDGGSAVDGNWNTGDNWVGDVAPAPGATTDLQFSGSTRLTANNNFSNGSQFRSIAFNSGAGPFTLTGNNLGIGASSFTVTNNSAAQQTISLNMAWLGNSGLVQNFTSSSAGGMLILSGVLSGGSSNNSVNLNLNNASGLSAIRITGSNTYISNTVLNSANNINTIEVGSNNAFGGILRTRGVQLMAVGGDRIITRTVDTGTISGIGFSIAGENSFTFSGGVGLGAINSGATDSSIIFNTGGTTVFSGGITATATSASAERITNLAGSGDVVLSGNMVNGGGGLKTALAWNNSQNLTISGSIASTGRTDLMGGTVNLDYSISDSSKLTEGILTLGGSKITLTGGTQSDSVASTTVSRGATTVARVSGSSALVLNAISRASGNGATLSFAADGLASTDTGNTNGILGGWATVGDNWAVNSTGGADGAITALASYQTDINNAGPNQNVSVSGNSALTASRAHNSLKIATTGAGETLDIGASQSLGLTSGGLLFSGSNDYEIDNGVLSALTSGDDLKVFVNGSGALSIQSEIQNGAGSNGLTKSGAGVLVLGGSNTFTGNVVVNQGTVKVASASALGAGTALILNGGTLATTQTFSLSRSSGVSLGVDGGTFDVSAGTTLTLSGSLINGTATYANTTLGSLTKVGNGTLVISDSNSYTGATVVSEGVLSVSSIRDGAELFSGSYGAGGSAASGIGASTSNYRNLVIDGGTLRYTGASTSSNRGFTIGTAGGTFDASGSGGLNLTGAEIFLSGSNTSRTLNLTGSNSDANTLAGPLADNGSGATSLVKSGAGKWVLSGSNTFSGGTVVNAGTLIVNSSAGSGSVTVNDGGALGGSGTIAGLTTVRDGGTLTPGNSPGIATFTGGLSMEAGAEFTFDLIADTVTGRGINYDGVNVTGGTFDLEAGVVFNLILNGAGSTTNYNAAFWDSDQSWLVFDNANAPAISGLFTLGSVSLDSLNNSFSVTGGSLGFSQVGNDIYLTYTAVPEPSTWMLLAGGLTAVLILRRRKHV